MTGPAILLAPPAESQEWRLRAECRRSEADPDLFFPHPSESWHVEAAKKVCRVCPVVQECLAAGLVERHGIWGGMTPHQRARIRHLQEADA